MLVDTSNKIFPKGFGVLLAAGDEYRLHWSSSRMWCVRNRMQMREPPYAFAQEKFFSTFGNVLGYEDAVATAKIDTVSFSIFHFDTYYVR